MGKGICWTCQLTNGSDHFHNGNKLVLITEAQTMVPRWLAIWMIVGGAYAVVLLFT
jgi:hypothetical protein